MPTYYRLSALLLALTLLATACGTNTASNSPTAVPTQAPASLIPTQAPSAVPTQAPSAVPTQAPSAVPTQAPSAVPTQVPASPVPTQVPASPVPGQASATLELRQVLDGLRQPLYLTHAGDGSQRVFVVEKRGIIQHVRNQQVVEPPFLDITDRVGANASEQGLLSVAFHPRFAETGLIFVNYTDKNGDTVVSRFSTTGDTADPASEKVLLQIDQPYANHNGGLVKFGPDGYLYIGMGDGGSGGDPQNNGQNPQALLGKMLRIDVDTGDPYAIPDSNPLINGQQSEIWATGLRNPWRFSFDRANGDLYIADVGQNRFEEVNRQPGDSSGGENYGWRPVEGFECFRDGCDPQQFVAPIDVYDHTLGCSVTGGYVYRGSAIAALQGSYIFGDYCSGRMWALRQAADGSWQRADLLQTRLSISSFGEDEAGELYVTDIRGGVYQIVGG